MSVGRSAKLVAWLLSTAMFALVLGMGIVFVIFLFTWHDCGPQPSDLVFQIPIACSAAVCLPLAVREWRKTRGAPPSYLWWLVVGFGPALVVPLFVWGLLARS